MKRFIALAALGLLLLSPTFASASIYAGPPNSQLSWEDGGGTVGSEFISNITANVIMLGVWDYGEDGLLSDHLVSLWTSGGTWITSALVPAGTGTTLINGYRYVSASASIVAGGEYVIGAGYYGPGEELGNQGASDLIASNALINLNFTWIEARDTQGVSNFVPGTIVPDPGIPVFPTPTTGVAATAWFGPNLIAIPEPASLIIWSLFGLGSMLGVRVWRRRGIAVPTTPASHQPWSDESRMAIHQIIEKGCRH